MNFLEIITKLFGNKQEKDIRAIQPIVDQVKAAYEQIDALSNDELRAHSWALMDKLQAAVADKKARIAELKASIEETPIEKREKIYNEVDKLEKEIKDKYEEVLNEILPEAFAIVKSAARRFAQSETVEVTASQMIRTSQPIRAMTSSRSSARKRSITTTGWPAVMRSHGIWCTMMCSSSVVSCCIRVRSPRWLPVKVRPLWQRYRCISMP